MNTDHIRQLADVIERQPHTDLNAPTGFNMCNWTHNCGTPACICGWANFVQDDDDIHLGDVSTAREWLGITPTHAAAVLRHLADTGKVDWSVGSST